jgi:hypothetical protein
MIIGKFVPKLETFKLTALTQQDPCHFEQIQKPRLQRPGSGVLFLVNSVKDSENQSFNGVFMVSFIKAVVLRFILSEQ